MIPQRLVGRRFKKSVLPKSISHLRLDRQLLHCAHLFFTSGQSRVCFVKLGQHNVPQHRRAYLYTQIFVTKAGQNVIMGLLGELLPPVQAKQVLPVLLLTDVLA